MGHAFSTSLMIECCLQTHPIRLFLQTQRGIFLRGGPRPSAGNSHFCGNRLLEAFREGFGDMQKQLHQHIHIFTIISNSKSKNQGDMPLA
jgi:hypothetical protein